jgi:hypothetical protein
MFAASFEPNLRSRTKIDVREKPPHFVRRPGAHSGGVVASTTRLMASSGQTPYWSALTPALDRR